MPRSQADNARSKSGGSGIRSGSSGTKAGSWGNKSASSGTRPGSSGTKAGSWGNKSASSGNRPGSSGTKSGSYGTKSSSSGAKTGSSETKSGGSASKSGSSATKLGSSATKTVSSGTTSAGYVTKSGTSETKWDSSGSSNTQQRTRGDSTYRTEASRNSLSSAKTTGRSSESSITGGSIGRSMSAGNTSKREGVSSGSLGVSKSDRSQTNQRPDSGVRQKTNSQTDRSSTPKTSVRTCATNHESSGTSHGSYVDHRNASSKATDSGYLTISDSNSKSFTPGSKIFNSEGVRVYKDNPLNRRLGRVGEPLGTKVYSKKGNWGTFCQVYANTWFNRSHNRVGKPLGSQPITRQSKHTQQKRNFLQSIQEDKNTDTLIFDERFDSLQIDQSSRSKVKSVDVDKEALDEAMYELNRMLEEALWKCASKSNKNPKTSKSVIKSFNGQTIAFKEIQIGKQIGQGGFGDVFFATWKGTTVAVKRLRQQNLSNTRLQSFTDEMLTLCRLDHPHIVRFIGACVVKPNLAIVMEYMQTSLHDALHVNDSFDFTEEERLSILRQASTGLQYLHGQRIAHCDLKSQNVLLDTDTDDSISVKLADFGLSMVMSDDDSLPADRFTERVSNVGTPRYSAPEVLRGTSLSAPQMMKTDIYSLALIIYEVVFQTEPFYDLTVRQIQKLVGEAGRLPEIPRNPQLNEKIGDLLKLSLDHEPANRPEIKDISACFSGSLGLYQ